MDVKLCRTCGRSGQHFIDIFKTEGLQNKIETCLPIIVSQHCLLPDTLCPECLMLIENFYIFLKGCLQNIIILENQLDIQESCLKAKRKRDKSCYVSLPLSNENKCVQTEDYLNILLGDSEDIKLYKSEFPLTNNFLSKERHFQNKLVDYEIDSDSNHSEDSGQIIFGGQLKRVINNVLDDQILSTKSLNNLHKIGLEQSDIIGHDVINEIRERKNVQKRKSDGADDPVAKISKIETSNKRKCSKPKKVEKNSLENNQMVQKSFEVVMIKQEADDFEENSTNSNGDNGDYQEDEQHEEMSHTMPQSCLLCHVEMENSASLAEHFMKVHSREASQSNPDYSNCDSEESHNEKKKRSIPSLLKISDLRRSESFEGSPSSDHQTEDESAPPSEIACPNCRATFSTKTELFIHLQLNHSEMSTYLCGICLKQANSVSSLRAHIMNCIKRQPITNRYICQVCCFGDDNYRTMESHILVHNFLWKVCQKEMKNFDPEDYIQKNSNFISSSASPIKNFSCLECNRSDFDTFRKFSIHRRNVHSIFHCDLCNKFYGRNSHLWKHVNRLHKNHPSITCQVCFKTSASKYHLAQHFAKIHQAKVVIKKEENYEDIGEKQGESEGYELSDARNTLKKQDSTDQEIANTSFDENSFSQSDNENSMHHKVAPKEIDPTHDLYTNILTNYTPPKNGGDYKCPKCSKGFHKRMLLRKHKKNCRPKLQKDLLTRCKTCARIFKDRQSLAKHLINYHSDYECEICNEKVPSKCEIVSHIRFQHPSSHLICSVCENILRCKKDLLEHLSDHENSFVCQFCGDALTSKVKLKMHILSLHRKILSLSCGICLKLFETQQVLRNHVALIHRYQLVPMISCPICGKNYGSKWKTFDHVNKSHGRFFKACKVCLEIYESESQLEAHIKTVHPNQLTVTSNTVKPNPVAMLNTPIKREEHGQNSNNQHGFETDSEGNTEETEPSQTSETEDEENIEAPVAEDQNQNIGETAQDVATQENKISLLERRLLGEALGQNDMEFGKNVASNLCKLHIVNNDLGTNKSTVEEKNIPLKINKGDESGHPMVKKENGNHHHHTKRTVYENSNDPCFCEICHKTWPAKKHLWQHYIRCHKRVAATVCGICLKTNDSYESLQIHLREVHPTLLHGQGYGSNFICRICGRYHNASSKLRLHMVIHEQFDWSLLEKFPPLLKSNTKILTKENGTQHYDNGKVINGGQLKYEQKEVKKETDLSNDNNEDIYDAMIEQVEETTTSTVETGHKTQGSTTESDEDNTAYTHTDSRRDSNPIQDNENVLSFSNLLQTLKNHNQYQALKQINQTNQSHIIKRVPDVSSNDNKPTNSNINSNVRAQSVICMRQAVNNSSSGNISNNLVIIDKVQNVRLSYLSEESSSSISQHADNGNNQIRNEASSHNGYINEETDRSDGDNGSRGDRYYSRNIFRPQAEELDTAVKSISSPSEPQVNTEYSDFNESVQQGNSLNETEIESAVGSIL